MSLAALLKDLWSGDYLTVNPGWVKAMLGERDTHFLGMMQHDAHEALIQLLDGVHEDLAHPDPDATALVSRRPRATVPRCVVLLLCCWSPYHQYATHLDCILSYSSSFLISLVPHTP